LTAESEGESGRGQRLAKLRLLCEQRRLLARAIVVGVLAGTLLAFLIPETVPIHHAIDAIRF
jgi:hypothetical protein